VNKQEWLEERKTYIGGSDLGSILGINNFRTELDVYFEKTSEGVAENTAGEAAYWGTVLEDVVAQEYAKRTGFKIEKPAGLIRHSEYPFIACNLDYWVIDNESNTHILECKTANQMKVTCWGEEGTNQIPESYLYQVAYYAAITGINRVDIAVLIGGQDFRIYRYDKDEIMEDKLIRVAKKFWNNHVIAGVPPKPKNDKDAAKLYPKANGLEVRADDIVLTKVQVLQDLKAREKTISEEIKDLQLCIKDYMQDAEFLVGNCDEEGETRGKCYATWKNSAGRTSVDTKKLKAEYSDIYQECLKTNNSYRIFSLKG
jgi:putative phage-type endonuclease